MNIQQYMTPEIVGPLTFVTVLFVAFLSSIQISKLSSILEYQEHEDEQDDCFNEVKPFVRKPQAGEIWYPRMSVGCPWAVETDSVRVMEIRNGWLKYSYEDTTTIMQVEEFIASYMRDDYGDFKVEDSTPEEPVAEEPKDERLEDIGFNVIKIHGEDFVLHPLEKKNDE